ncbi:MAG: hypothetical protein JNL50_02275 [Phycisphaerae bacterium]|nr:hypothetical protein [Phycisphaerae bacterium]
MGPSEKSFQQVKSILGKLDRSIDSARQARLQPGAAGVPAIVPTVPVTPLVKPMAPSPATPGTATQAARPSFGRAQPLPRPTNGNPGGKWL